MAENSAGGKQHNLRRSAKNRAKGTYLTQAARSAKNKAKHIAKNKAQGDPFAGVSRGQEAYK